MTTLTRRSLAKASPAAEDGLLARLRAGDGEAFEELVRATSPKLLATLRRMLRNEEDARDALQETFLAAFRALESFEGQAQLSTWLHRIALNTALMKLRSCRRRPEESIEDLLPRFEADGHRVLDAADEAAVPVEEAVDARRLQIAVRRAIDRLPETHRIVLLLRDLEGIANAETAEILGITPDAAKTRLHRARQALRTLLVREGVFGAQRSSAEREESCAPALV